MTKFDKFAAWCERDDYCLFWPNLMYWVCVALTDTVTGAVWNICRALADSTEGEK